MTVADAEGTCSSWEDLARAAGAGVGEESPDELRQLLAFRLGDTTYALSVERVREIVRIRPTTPIPRVSADVCGAISLRGEIVQVLDLRRRLGLPSMDPNRASRIVVAYLEDDRVAGLLVDEVCEVLRVRADSIGPPPGGESMAVEALCARGDEFVSLIALDRVVQVDG